MKAIAVFGGGLVRWQKMLTLNQYAVEHFDGNKKELAQFWGVAPQQLSDWKGKFVFYVVGEDHLRVPVKNIRKVNQ